MRLARNLDRAALAAMTTTLPLAELDRPADAILAGDVRGRTVVTVA